MFIPNGYFSHGLHTRLKSLRIIAARRPGSNHGRRQQCITSQGVVTAANPAAVYSDAQHTAQVPSADCLPPVAPARKSAPPAQQSGFRPALYPAVQSTDAPD